MMEEYRLTNAAMEKMNPDTVEMVTLYNKMGGEQRKKFKIILWRWNQLNEAIDDAKKDMTPAQPA